MGILHRAGRCVLVLVAAFSLFAAGASQAASRYWNLQGVTFEDGAVAYGSFAYDDVSRVVTSWNISVTDGADPQFFEFTYMPGNSTVTVNTNWSAIPTIYFISAGAGTPPYARELRLTPNQVLDGAPTTVPLDVAVAAGNVECINCDPFRLVTSGSLVFTLLPPAAALVEVIEYYNASVDHYFITAIPQEIANLDGGLAPGWTRTGLSFLAFASGSGGGGAERQSGVPLLRAVGDDALLLRDRRRMPRRRDQPLRDLGHGGGQRVPDGNAQHVHGCVPVRHRARVPRVQQPARTEPSVHDERHRARADGSGWLGTRGLRSGRRDHVLARVGGLDSQGAPGRVAAGSRGG